MSDLALMPISLKRANAYVKDNHRHSLPTRGHKFSIGLSDSTGELVGVAIVGRPVARMLDDGYTAEVLRVCTLGHKNACSMLYGAARRASIAMGYTKVVTYIREDENGSSLKASGWHPVGAVLAQEWSRPSRSRKPAEYEVIARVRWETV